MSEFDELRRQLRIAYGAAIEDARTPDWPAQYKFADAIGMTMNTFRRTEMGERDVTAAELDIIEIVLRLKPGTLRNEAWRRVSEGEIPSHAERSAESWRRFLNPKRRR